MAARGNQQARQSGKRSSARTQRRASERAHAKQQAGGAPPWATPQIIGSVVTGLIVLGIVLYAVIRSNNASNVKHTASGPPLTTPANLHPAASMLHTGQPAPNFSLRGVNGGTYSLAAQRGHPVLLEFFAVWCPHCQREAATIERLRQQYASKGVRFWAILANPYGPNYDNSFGQDTALATKKDVLWFSKTFHEHATQLIDPRFTTVNTYGINGYPGIYVVNKQGKITYSQSGEQPYSAIASAINKAVSGS